MAARGTELLARVGLAGGPRHARVEVAPPGREATRRDRPCSGHWTSASSSWTSRLPASRRRETERLYEVIDGLKAGGVSVLYISHRLAEVKRCADRVVVLRDGRNAGELAKADITHDNMVRLMVGRDLKQFYPKVHRTGRRRARRC